VLQSSTNAAGPYLDVPAAASPYTNAPLAAPVCFFRLRLPVGPLSLASVKGELLLDWPGPFAMQSSTNVMVLTWMSWEPPIRRPTAWRAFPSNSSG
jgi:hypothetical protein